MPYSKEAKTIPISDSLITLKFIIDVKDPTIVSQFDGGMIRIEKEGSPVYGFNPYICDSDNRVISVKVFKILIVIKNDKFVGKAINLVPGFFERYNRRCRELNNIIPKAET